jgi:hypothetical protein
MHAVIRHLCAAYIRSLWGRCPIPRGWNGSRDDRAIGSEGLLIRSGFRRPRERLLRLVRLVIGLRATPSAERRRCLSHTYPGAIWFLAGGC